MIDDFEFMVRIISNSNWVLFCEGAVLKYRSGVANNLSGKKSKSHMDSAFRSLNLGIQQILATKNDSRSRQACANTYRRWSYLFFPADMELYKKMEIEIEKLGGSTIKIIGSKPLLLLSRLIGWKRAKILKIWIRGKA